ncbi:MAG: hypothetical protein ING09_13290 [Roseomonas sp.]|nr:hypothetical protein [Roseomonas sp.]MCA3292259.1 hypothetical protein [Roseomonas sp.]MCA3296198.1 hypothetical protein [Roseomonas sp.]
MSLQLYIAIPAICDPSAKDLNAAAAAFELPIILENSFNLKSVDGFQPATFNGEQTGAEISIEDKAEVFDMYPDFAEAAPQLDRVVTLRWVGDFLEMAFANGIAAAIAKACGGVIYEPQGGSVMSIEAAIAEAKSSAQLAGHRIGPQAKTARQKTPFKAMIDHIASEFPAYHVRGKWVFQHIGNHHVSGMFFDGPPSKFNMKIHFVLRPLSLFGNPGGFAFAKTARVYIDGTFSVDIRAPGFSNALVELIKSDFVPFSDRMRSFPAMVVHVRNGLDTFTSTSWPDIRLAWCDCVTGQFEQARAHILEAFASVEKYNLQDLLDTPRFVQMREILPLLEHGDPGPIGNYLRERERREVEYLQIQELWQPAPFPFERPVSG